MFEDVEGNCASATVRFLRGDANVDGSVDLSDAVSSLRFLFLNEGPLACTDAADANDDGLVDILDPVATLLSLFTGTVEIPAPGKDACGVDPTDDALDCRAHVPCLEP